MGHVRSCKICEGNTVLGLLRRNLSKRRWYFQAKVDGVTLRVALQCGGNSSVKNIPLGEPGLIPLSVGLQSACGYVDGDQMFCLYVSRGLLLGTAQT